MIRLSKGSKGMLKLKTIQNWLFVSLLIVTGILFQPISAQTLFNQSQGITATKIGIDPTKLLKPTEAFIPQIHLQKIDRETGEYQLLLMWEINPNYYLYKEKIDLELKNANGEIIDIALPQGIEHEDEFFGQQEIYDNTTMIPLTLKSDGINTGYFNIEAQGCAKSGYCFAPQNYDISLEIDPSISRDRDQIRDVVTKSESIPEITSEHDRLTQYLYDNEYLAIPLFFLLGLLLTFTPCVLPMLPILSGILTRSGHLSPKKGFTISLVYVLAMALVYTFLGLLAAYFGKGLAAYLQNAYVLIGFGLLFVLLSLSMFGLYQLQMPAIIQSKLSMLSNKQSNKDSYLGTAIMGMLSALIVGPCVTAPLIGIISLVAQSQNYLLGGAALFAMSLGMGVPLLILGASSGHLLPKAGPWMDKIKVLFGFMLLGLAAYFIGRTLPFYWEQTLYAVIALATFIWLMVTVVESGPKARLFFGVLALATLFFGIHSIHESGKKVETALFTPIKGISGLNDALSDNNNRVTMLEFNADWCVACKEMEKYVFSDLEVKSEMGKINLLIADITANDSKDQRLQEHFEIYGPPAMLFFAPNGEEIPQLRVMGSVPKEEFLNHLRTIINHYNGG